MSNGTYTEYSWSTAKLTKKYNIPSRDKDTYTEITVTLTATTQENHTQQPTQPTTAFATTAEAHQERDVKSKGKFIRHCYILIFTHISMYTAWNCSQSGMETLLV
jgi:hypothetical protein